MPPMPIWNHPLKVSLGCARRPGREPFQTGPFGGDGYALRYKNSTHRFPFFRGGVLPRVHRGHRHCFPPLSTHFRAARTADDQAPAMKRAHWKWPPMAKVDALLWLANQRPLLETLPRGDEEYAELRGSLRENHGAPETLGGQAVFGQLRNLFKEHASDGKYAPDLKVVVRVLAAVTETLPDAVAAPADVAVAMPMESIAPSSPLPTTAAGPAAPLHAGMKGAGAALSAAGAAAAGFMAGAKKMAKAVAGKLESLKFSMRFTTRRAVSRPPILPRVSHTRRTSTSATRRSLKSPSRHSLC